MAQHETLPLWLIRDLEEAAAKEKEELKRFHEHREAWKVREGAEMIREGFKMLGLED